MLGWGRGVATTYTASRPHAVTGPRTSSTKLDSSGAGLNNSASGARGPA